MGFQVIALSLGKKFLTSAGGRLIDAIEQAGHDVITTGAGALRETFGRVTDKMSVSTAQMIPAPIPVTTTGRALPPVVMEHG